MIRFWQFIYILAATSFIVPTLSGKDFSKQEGHNLVNEQHDCAYNIENCVKKIFNDKKSAIVRVVCAYNENLPQNKQVLAGTGFLVSSQGYVLTTSSIAKGAESIRVDYYGMSYPAECIGYDTATNVAILKLLQLPISCTTINISEDDISKLTPIGSVVVFVGCKFGMDPSPDIGLVSGKNISYSDHSFLTTYLRTTLSFSGGESGAPVFDINGEFSGMMIASLPEMNASFILPRRALSKIFNDIVANGMIKHAKLAIDIHPEHILGQKQVLVVSNVTLGSTAASAGIVPGDIIQCINSTTITYKEDLYNALFFAKTNQPLDVEILRTGEIIHLSIMPEFFAE